MISERNINTRIPETTAQTLGHVAEVTRLNASKHTRTALGDYCVAYALYHAGANALPVSALHSLLVVARELERDRDVDTRCAAMAWRQRCALIAVRVATGTAGEADVLGCLTGVPECVINHLAASVASLKDSK